ncbi:diacylglycerol O-acyltransferase [Acrasis kona]|uniref:Diacylglycerol O-acyltransferase n=1 Tax=Acrasis kona TaxID=1008807 RepID=A0AAW2YXE9_9EUKA
MKKQKQLGLTQRIKRFTHYLWSLPLYVVLLPYTLFTRVWNYLLDFYMDPIAAFMFKMDLTNTNIMNALLTFDSPLDLDKLRGLVSSRMNRPPFQHKVRVTWYGWPYLVSNEELDLDEHIVHHKHDRNLKHSELEEKMAMHMNSPMNPEKQLWKFIVHEYKDGKSFMVMRMHHCVADGMTSATLLLNLCTLDEKATSLLEELSSKYEESLKLRKRVPKPSVVEFIKKLYSSMLKISIMGLFREDHHVFSRGGDLFPYPFNFAASPIPCSLQKIKNIALKFQAAGTANRITVNDVLLAGISGAMHKYASEYGSLWERERLSREESIGVRTILTVSTASIRNHSQFILDSSKKLVSRMRLDVGSVFLDLPISTADPKKRLMEIGNTTHKLLNTPEPLISKFFSSVMGSFPRNVTLDISTRIGDTSSTVLSNVMGPPCQIHMVGVPVTRIMYKLPPNLAMGVMIGFYSYNGDVTMTVGSFDNVVNDPRKLVRFFHEEIETLDKLTCA